MALTGRIPVFRLPTKCPLPSQTLRHSDVQQYTDGQLKWIVQNGIRMSGMPAWNGILSDDEMWAIVRFLRHLPQKGSLGLRRFTSIAPANISTRKKSATEDRQQTAAKCLSERQLKRSEFERYSDCRREGSILPVPPQQAGQALPNRPPSAIPACSRRILAESSPASPAGKYNWGPCR